MSRLFSESREGREMRRPIQIKLDGSCELYEALRTITHARNFLGNIPGVFLMTMLPLFGKSRFEIAFVFPKFDGTYKEREARNEIVPRDRWIGSISSKAAFHALRPDGKAFFNDNDVELYVRCNSGHTRYVELEPIGRPLWKYQDTWEEPSYDLPNGAKHRDQDHEDESAANPRSIDQDRKIVPFRIHMACVDDIIYGDEESGAALTHVPKGRDALSILAFTRDNHYNIRIAEERTALSEHTIDPCSIFAAFDTDGQPLQSSYWIMNREQCESKTQEFA